MEIQNPCLDFGGTRDQNHLAPETTTPWNNWAHLIHLRFNYVFAIKIINKIVLQFTSPLRPSKNRVKKCQGGWMINWRDIRKKMCLKKKSSSHFTRKFREITLRFQVNFDPHSEHSLRTLAPNKSNSVPIIIRDQTWLIFLDYNHGSLIVTTQETTGIVKPVLEQGLHWVSHGMLYYMVNRHEHVLIIWINTHAFPMISI